MKKTVGLFLCAVILHGVTYAMDHPGITFPGLSPDRFTLIEQGVSTPILFDEHDDVGVLIALESLSRDFKAVSGEDHPERFTTPPGVPAYKRIIIAGTLQSKYIDRLVRDRKIDRSALQGKREKYIMTVVQHPVDGIEEALVIAGSDKRGTIYGIYELSEQIGVSPWYDWADVPVRQCRDMSIVPGVYTAGEPAVRYRGIFLNDEAPCLTTWVKNMYGTSYGDHRFYARVFELILRLRGNFLWPAMWDWAFYADDELNSRTADEMGIVIGTSHHEPMARNHQEWARNPKAYGGVWDYAKNPAELDRFFREGIQRAASTEDIFTIGMRGDGDASLAGTDEDNMKMLENLFNRQRQIIKEVCGKSASRHPQVWALYKEVQTYYNKGLRVPDDVIVLLSDDNWGDVRKLPDAKERLRKGGWGMYYHVDYVGAPRNSKWLNITPIQNLWEQMQLTYDYGVDQIWVLNVGDLKPMEYPITLFLDMAWNPTVYNAVNLLGHTRRFCAQAFGEDQADEAARLLNLCCKYNGRISAEMLDRTTYNLETGEFRRVCDDYIRLEAEALRQYMSLSPEYRDTYQQLILFPIQAMGNIYEMYYAQAMNWQCYQRNDPAADMWADRCEQAFQRDAQLCHDYNQVMSGGKWNGMMIQKHIGYTSWNDNFQADRLPRLYRMEDPAPSGGYVFSDKNGCVVMEAEHFYEQQQPVSEARWQIIPYMGRTLSGLALMPYSQPTDGASVSYRFTLPDQTDQVRVMVVVKSTLAFARTEGHRYTVSLDDGEAQTVTFNERLNEDARNIYSVYYPTVAKRVVESTVRFPVSSSAAEHVLTIRPIEPGTVFEKVIVDFGGYIPSFLYMDESDFKRVDIK